MDTKIERFFAFILKENFRKFFAFALYVSCIVMCMKTELSLALRIVRFIIEACLSIFILVVLNLEWADKMSEGSGEKIQEIKKIVKEILKYIPIWVISCCITNFIMVGQSVNQTSVEQALYEEPIPNLMIVIIFAPILEEILFRFLPYIFIKNSVVYILVSSVVFGLMHVINDPNPLYYIWFYMIDSLYYGYRYYKTKDVFVTISLHSFNNVVATLLIFIL